MINDTGEAQRVRRIGFSPRILLLSYRTGEVQEVMRGIPYGARFVGAYMDDGDFYLLAEHESFAEVQPGERYPLLIPEIRAVGMRASER